MENDQNSPKRRRVIPMPCRKINGKKFTADELLALTERINQEYDMNKYIKTIDAVQWFKEGDSEDVVAYNPELHLATYDYILEKAHSECGHLIKNHGFCVKIQWGLVCPGYWIIKDANGKLSLCKPDEFKQLYNKKPIANSR